MKHFYFYECIRAEAKRTNALYCIFITINFNVIKLDKKIIRINLTVYDIKNYFVDLEPINQVIKVDFQEDRRVN